MDQPTLLLAGTFLLVLAVVLLPYWLLVSQPEQKAQQSLRKRITTTAAVSPTVTVGILKQVEQLSKIGLLNRLLSQTSLGTSVVKRLIDQASVRVTVSTVLLASGVLLFAVATLAMNFLHFGLLMAFGLGALSGWVPILVLQVLARRRLNKFEEQFPEAIDLLGRTLRAGHAFSTGLQVAAQELPDPVGTEFRVIYERQNFGMPMSEALHGFAERVPLLDARFFVTAVLTQQESGGNLTEVLDNLATVIRERFRVKRQLRVISSHGRFTAVVLSAMPPVLAAYMFLRSPENLQILLADPLGQKMIATAVALQLIGALLIRKIADVKY